MSCNGFARASLACGLLVLLGCGDQTSPAYRGESLLSFSGRVELVNAPTQDELVPALAFQGVDGYWKLLDVDVEGEFPAGFTLHVFDPPPEGTLSDLAAIHDGEPVIAVAYITAVSPDHAPGFQSSNSWGEWPDCMGVTPCHRVHRQFCYTEQKSAEKVPAIEDCYVEVRMCDFEIDFEQEQNYDSCELVQSEGDASLGEDIGTRFSGFSQTHLVIYLASAAPARSFVARLLGSPDGVAAGYHLAERRKRTQAEVDEADRCDGEAIAVALERFRVDHPDADCEGIGDPLPQTTTCADDEQGHVLAGYVLDVQGERKCPAPGDTALTLVDTDNTRLTIQIGYGIGEFGFPL